MTRGNGRPRFFPRGTGRVREAPRVLKEPTPWCAKHRAALRDLPTAAATAALECLIRADPRVQQRAARLTLPDATPGPQEWKWALGDASPWCCLLGDEAVISLLVSLAPPDPRGAN